MAEINTNRVNVAGRRLAPLELLKAVVGHALPAQAVLEKKLRQAIDGRALDTFAESGFARFATDLAKRATCGRPLAAVQWLAIDGDVLFAMASVLSELTGADGLIDADQVEARYGGEAAALVREAERTRPQGDQIQLSDYPGLETRLQRIDSKLLKAYAREKGQPGRLPVIQKCVERLNGARPLDGFNAVMVQHMLGTQVELLSALEAAGLDPKRCTLLGRGYSDSRVVQALASDQGYTVYDTQKSGFGGYEAQHEAAVRKAIAQAVARAQTNGKPILLLDDGGLAAKIIHEEFPQYAHLFRGVEQTTHGITQLDKLKKNHGGLKMGIVDVARAWAKRIEAEFIDQAATQRLLADLEAVGRGDLKGKSAVVYAYGPIGAALARGLRALGVNVTVVDPSGSAREEAEADGFETVTPEQALELLKTTDLALGCSGHRSLGPGELGMLKDGAIVASCSSAEVEVDTAYLGSQATAHKLPTRGGYESNHETHEMTLDGRRLLLMNRGYPMNFDGTVNSVRPEDIQLTQALMFAAAIQAAEAEPSAEPIALDADEQRRIVDDFNAVRAPRTTVEREAPAPVEWPLVTLGLDTADAPSNKNLLRIARHTPSAVVGDSVAVIPDYPGVGGALWVGTDVDRYVLPSLQGTPCDFRAVGQSLLVWTAGHDGKRQLQIYDRPPLAVTADGQVQPRTSVASLRATLPDVEYSLVGGTVLVPDRTYQPATTLVYRDTQGRVRFVDLDNGEQGQVQGLPPLEGHDVRVLAGKGLIFDETSRALHFLGGADARSVHRSFELPDAGTRLFQDGMALIAVSRATHQEDDATLRAFDLGSGQLMGTQTFALPEGASLFGAKMTAVEDALTFKRSLAVRVAAFPPDGEPSASRLTQTTVPMTFAAPERLTQIPVVRASARLSVESVATPSAPPPDGSTAALSALIDRAKREGVPSSAWADFTPRQSLDFGSGRRALRFEPSGRAGVAVLVGEGDIPSKVLPWPVTGLEPVGHASLAVRAFDSQSREVVTYLLPAGDLDPSKAIALKSDELPYLTPAAQYRFDRDRLVRVALDTGELQRSARGFDCRSPNRVGPQSVLAFDAATKTLAVLEPQQRRVALLDPKTLAEVGAVPLPDDGRVGYALERLADGQLSVHSYEPRRAWDERIYRVDLAARQVTGVRAVDEREFTSPNSVPPRQTLKLDVSQLHPKVRQTLTRHDDLAFADVGFELPGSLRAIHLKVANAEQGLALTTRLERLEAFVPVLETLWRAADEKHHRRGDAVDLSLAREWLRELTANVGQAGAQADQRVNGNHQARLEMALIAGGDAVLPQVDALLEVIHKRPPEVTRALGVDVITEASVFRALEEYGGPQAIRRVAERAAAQLKSSRIEHNAQSNNLEPYYSIRAWGQLATLAGQLREEGSEYEAAFAPFFAAVPSATREEQQLRDQLLRLRDGATRTS